MFKDLKIMPRLAIGFGAMLLIMITLGVVGLRQMNHLSELTGKMYAQPVQVSHLVQRMEANLLRMHSAMKDVTLAKISQEVSMARITMDDLQLEIEKDLAAITTLYPKEKRRIREAREAFASWLPIRDEVLHLVTEGQVWRAAEIAKGRGAAHMDAIAQNIAILHELSQGEAESFIRNTWNVRQNAFILMYWALGLAITGGCLFTWLFTRSVATPIHEIVEVSDAIANGDLTRQITHHSKDEMGQMAQSLRQMLSGVIGEGQSIKRGLPIVLWTTDTDLVMTFINDPAQKLFMELTGLAGDAHIGISTVGEVMKDREGLSHGMAEKSLLYGSRSDMELYFALNDGEHCFRCVTTQLKNLSDNVVGVMGVAIDISQRIRMEQQLTESESRLEEAQKIAHLGHWECTPEEGQVTWSRELFRILGLQPIPTPISSRMVRQLVSPEIFETMCAILMEIMDKGIHSFEHAFTRPDGQKCWIQGRGIQAEETGEGPLTLFGTVQDITEQKATETKRQRLEAELRQSQKLQAIGTLAGGIAHDFNNILAAILGFSELLRDESDDGSETAQNLDEIIRAALRARDLVKQILNFSRQTDLEKKPIAMSETIDEAVNLLRATLPTTISIAFDRENAPAHRVHADPTQLHQMVMNLGTNAAHAMRDRGERIEISLTEATPPPHILLAAPHLKDQTCLSLTVKDEGCGLSPEDQERIFDPFFTTKAPGEGTGMGLSVVHGIVQNMGGAVDLTSIQGEGSTFFVWLPVSQAEPDAQEPLTTEGLPRGQEKILLVDDESSLVTSGYKILEKLGYDVTFRQSATEALDIFEASRKAFDLVITDMTMPGMSGAKLAKKLLDINPDLPIILLTGYSHDMDESRARSLGIKRYLLKPTNRSELARTVREVLSPSPDSPS